MKKIVALCAALALLSACEKPAESVSRTTNSEFNVETLFTHQGCTVFRFRDRDRPVYFAKCSNSANTQTMFDQRCGKSCTQPMTIRTE